MGGLPRCCPLLFVLLRLTGNSSALKSLSNPVLCLLFHSFPVFSKLLKEKKKTLAICLSPSRVLRELRVSSLFAEPSLPI